MQICGYEFLPPIDNDVLNVIIGATIGFASSTLLQILIWHREKRQKLNDSANYVMMHSLKFINSLNTTKVLFHKSINDLGGINCLRIENVTQILPAAIEEKEIPPFEYSELKCLFTGDKNEALNKLFKLERFQNQLVSLCQIHRSQHDNFLTKMKEVSIQTELNNSSIISTIPPDKVKDFQHDFFNLKATIESIYDLTNESNFLIDDYKNLLQISILKTTKLKIGFN